MRGTVPPSVRTAGSRILGLQRQGRILSGVCLGLHPRRQVTSSLYSEVQTYRGDDVTGQMV